MELARTAKEPFNYFLLLRALFRSIGGGSHDLLYQEFLPLLPSLLQGRLIDGHFVFTISEYVISTSQSINQSKDFLCGLSSGTTARSTETVS